MTPILPLSFLVLQCTGPYCGPDALFERPTGSQFGRAAGPAAGLTDAGAFVVAWESRAGGESDILFNRREPGASGGWGEPRRLDTDRPGEARSFEVRLATGGPDDIFVCWQDARNGRDDILFQRSLDGGRSWLDSESRLDADAPGAATSSMAAIAADRSGRVVVVWEDLRHGARDIHVRSSIDRGATWGAEQRVDSDPPGTGVSYHPQLAVWGDGTVLVCWWDERDGSSDLYVRRGSLVGAPNPAVRWGEAERRLDAGVAGSAPSRDARVFAEGSGDGHRVAIAWEEAGRAGNAEVVVRVSEDRGATWGPVVPVGHGVSPIPFARVDGPVSVAWIRERGARTGEKTSIGGRIVEIGPSLELRVGEVPEARPENAQPKAVTLSSLDEPSSVWLGSFAQQTLPDGTWAPLWAVRTGNNGGRAIVEVHSAGRAGSARSAGNRGAGNPWVRRRILPFGGGLLNTDQWVSAHSLTGAVDSTGALHAIWVAELGDFRELGYLLLESPAAPPGEPLGRTPPAGAGSSGAGAGAASLEPGSH